MQILIANLSNAAGRFWDSEQPRPKTKNQKQKTKDKNQRQKQRTPTIIGVF
jgi:Na+-transporting methylmalonyl-CoA/oxaloacetate decarboxylase gamma subunit